MSRRAGLHPTAVMARVCVFMIEYSFSIDMFAFFLFYSFISSEQNVISK
jgi:hypothetical protein